MTIFVASASYLAIAIMTASMLSYWLSKKEKRALHPKDVKSYALYGITWPLSMPMLALLWMFYWPIKWAHRAGMSDSRR